ncbi:MAG: 50S ribosomal protein L24 [Gammaproteobacteria bacterium]|nr:50S ribosomal protein L24 [Gammaproteobacteria bacterium]
MHKIRKGDEVIVVSGSDKGRRGVVLQFLPYNRLLVEGVNVRKKHIKGNPQDPAAESGIVDRETSIHISNVALYNPIAKKGDKVGVRQLADGKRVRFFKSTDEVVDI